MFHEKIIQKRISKGLISHGEEFISHLKFNEKSMNIIREESDIIRTEFSKFYL